MLTRLSESSLESLSREVAKYLDSSMRRAGGVVDSILGLDARGIPILTVLPEGAEEAAGDMETLITPGPFREHEKAIKEKFRRRDIQAALFWGEAWTFPPGETAEAFARHVREGLMPSEHPRRMEIVFLSAHWPRGGVGWLSSWRIVRTPTGDYLRPMFQQSGSSRDEQFSIFTSWLDNALPNPEPGD